MTARLEVKQAAAALMVLHQRHKGGCLCGGVPLGASYTDHVAQVLADAGLLCGSGACHMPEGS